MNDEEEIYRYLFTVRQRFNKEPDVDAFYKLRVPAGLDEKHVAIFGKLNEKFMKEEIREDASTLNAMQTRLRFNADMYPHVCLVRVRAEITSEDLSEIVANRFRENKLTEFLDEAAVK